MTEYVTLKKKDLLDVYDEALDDERELLESLYPDVLPPEEEEEKRNVTGEIRFEKKMDFFKITHDGHTVSTQRNLSEVSDGGELTVRFSIPSSDYRFEVTPNGNWRLIKEDG